MPTYRSEEIIKFLKLHGWIVDHIKGSHHIMYDPISKKRTVVPLHKKDLPIGTTHAILKQTGFTKDEVFGK